MDEVKAGCARGHGCGELNRAGVREELVALVKRPMRLVGVVRNEGHAGGGPFWVQQQEGLDKGWFDPKSWKPLS